VKSKRTELEKGSVRQRRLAQAQQNEFLGDEGKGRTLGLTVNLKGFWKGGVERLEGEIKEHERIAEKAI